MSNQKHTPTPWHYTYVPDRNGEGDYQIDALSGTEDKRDRHLWPDIASLHVHAPNETARAIAKANAAHIVRCVNSYDQLLITLDGMLSAFACPCSKSGKMSAVANARHALSQARGDSK